MRRYTVRSLTSEIERVLQSRYPMVEVEGEVAQLNTPSSGHAYLNLRDRDAVLGAVCWRDTWRRLGHRPSPGERVVCRGRIGVYANRGAYQLYVLDIAPVGLGRLAAEIARRRARLEAEGLLDPRRKRPLPAFPRVVGVATSRTGAALQDFLEVSRARFPSARILVAPCTVQGTQTPPSVIQAVELLLDDGRAEVIVVTRGGGSSEDLLGFQDLELARFLAHCPVPVLSAVGHQVDTTLADLVADAVAATPSAAAVRVFPEGPALVQRVDEAEAALVSSVHRRIVRARERIAALRARLRHPGERVAQVRRRAGDALRRLVMSARSAVRHRASLLTPLQARLARSARQSHQQGAQRLHGLQARLEAATRALLLAQRQRLARATTAAHALSPQAVLDRGFAVVVGPDGVLTDPTEVPVGAALDIVLARGRLSATVGVAQDTEDP